MRNSSLRLAFYVVQSWFASYPEKRTRTELEANYRTRTAYSSSVRFGSVRFSEGVSELDLPAPRLGLELISSVVRLVRLLSSLVKKTLLKEEFGGILGLEGFSRNFFIGRGLFKRTKRTTELDPLSVNPSDYPLTVRKIGVGSVRKRSLRK